MTPARTLQAALLVLCCAAAVAAQEQQPPPPCQLKLKDAPEVRGFRLGMTLAQLKARFPDAPVNDADFGLKGVRFASHNFKGPEEEAFKGVTYVSLEFVDDKLVMMAITYTDAVRWQSTDQFVARISESLKLPREGWEHSDPSASLKCEGFSVSVYPNNISITDPSGGRLIDARRREREEARRRNFKP